MKRKLLYEVKFYSTDNTCLDVKKWMKEIAEFLPVLGKPLNICLLQVLVFVASYE